ncbi:hypothetical protein ACI68E_003674 [Malassezia pachydermatis]
MVIFKSNATKADVDDIVNDVTTQGGTVRQRYDAEFLRGFAAAMPSAYAQRLLAATKDGQHPTIEYMEADQSVSTST